MHRSRKSLSLNKDVVPGKWLAAEERLLFLAAMRYSAPFISSTKKSTAALIALYNVYGESEEGARLTALCSATNLSAGEGGSQGSEEEREARRTASLLAPVQLPETLSSAVNRGGADSELEEGVVQATTAVAASAVAASAVAASAVAVTVTVEAIEREVQVLLRREGEQPVVRAPKRQAVSWTDIADCVPGK
jgi:hypothetical protein